ncbi:MAG: hypothetical protein SF339_26405 [Blastocatellia bacterium]|nr:hypothetical protein [Blastocatellia bacterium]
MRNESADQNDKLLLSWLQALRTQGEASAEPELARLIETQIAPVIRGVIRFKLRLGSTNQEEEADLTQEALTQWLAELRKLRERPDERAIGDVRGLAATITYRVCAGWLRARAPRRHTLRYRLQYVLTRQAGLALWPGEGSQEKQMLAGFAVWRGRPPVSTDALRRLPEDDAFLARAGRLLSNPKLNELVAAILDAAGGPVPFDELVQTAATLLQVRDDPPASTEEAMESGKGHQFASDEDLAWQTEKRFFLERLWEEVRELPLPQRRALLFNLREEDGGGCLALFQATGIATIRQMAETLDLPAERFAELWPELPLDDASIAALLDLTRQQVINLRKSARERLARRLRGFF